MNGDGYITRTDLKKALGNLGLRSSKEEDEDLLWGKLLYNDKNGDGRISLEEFRKFAAWRVSKLRATFDNLDKRWDGYLDADEIHTALREYGLDASLSKVEKIVERMDVNNDGRVSFEEFRQITLLFPSTKISRIFDHAGEVFVVGYLSIPKNASSEWVIG